MRGLARNRRIHGGFAVALALGLCTFACSPSETAPPAPSRLDGNFLTEAKVLYSQYREEVKIRHFFDDERDGFYVDVGAWRPIKNSTTAYLESRLGWRGIAIDASPGLADGWRSVRPGAKFFQYIVTDRSGERQTLYLGYGVSSTEEESTRRFSKPEQKLKAIEVETITLNDLLEREGVDRIDFLSMDIEGGEPKALAGFDIERFKPRLVCIESGAKVPELRAAIAAYFDAHGYRRIAKYEDMNDPNWYLEPSS